MSARDREAYKLLADMHHDLIVAMQAAVIEMAAGRGAEAGMQWIINTLSGPGLLPSKDEPFADNAQFYFSANQSAANRLPMCACGNPSHIGWMGQGFCSDEHYRAAKAKAAH